MLENVRIHFKYSHHIPLDIRDNIYMHHLYTINACAHVHTCMCVYVFLQLVK